MAVTITATRTSSLFTDQDGDGQFDPGDVITTRIRITNSGSDPATSVSVTDTLSGLTLSPGSVKVTPIAYDDAFSLTGNTPITIGAAQGLLLNDVDPDGVGGNTGLTVVSVDTTGTQGTVAFNANGSFTFTPTTGFVGITAFKYYVQDAQGLGNVTEGIVTMTVTDKVWYVDNTYGGENGASDGSYLKPFTSLTPLNTNGADADGAGDTIFVYRNGGNYTAGITLEAGQKLLGDGVGFVVNGHNIGGTERTGGVDNVTTNAVISQSLGTVVTLSTDNVVRGFTLDSNGASVVGMADGNGSVTTAAGTLTVNAVSFTGTGQAIDIDQGGNLAVTVDSLTSSGSPAQGVQLAGTAASGTGLITGSVAITAGTIGGATGILLGAAGGGTASSGGNVNLTYGGVITGATGTSVEIQDRTGGTATFNGNITHSTTATSGIVVDSLGTGTVNFNGQSTSITTTTGTAISLTNNTGGTINFTPAAGGNGLDISAGAGTGLTFTGGGTLSITGTGNSITTTTGQIMNLTGTMGTGGIAFQSLTSGTVAAGAGNAINISNLDAAGAGTFSGGAVTIAGAAGGDGINIFGGSNSTFTFASATIGGGAAGTNPISGDGIELNGANGSVTFATVNVNGAGGAGVNIVSATNAVNINGGNIGATNDSGDDGVRISGGTGAVTIAASVTKTTSNEVVDISSHATGAISFTGAISSNSGGGGIRVVNNSSGNISFSGDVTLNTGTVNAINFINSGATGANVTFSEGSLDIDTTSGTGINATSTTVGVDSLTISGATGPGNIVTSTTGRAINIDGITANITLNEVNVSGGGTTTGVFLKNTGAGGQFVVTGEGSAQGSGGTIANIGGADMGSAVAAQTQGTGIYMENVSNVSLSNMIIGANAGTMNNFGIRGESVNNFTLTDSEFRGDFGTSTALDEGTIRFGNAIDTLTTGLTGTALFQGNNIGVVAAGNDGSIEAGLAIYVYGSNSLNLTIRDTPGGDQAVFGHNNLSSGTDDFYLESGGTSNVTILIEGVAFTGSRGDLAQISSSGDTTQNITVKNNQFHNTQVTTLDGGGSLNITGSLTGGNVTYLVEGNSFKGSRSANFFSLFNGNNGDIKGVVLNNTFGTNNGSYDSSQANYSSLNGGAIFAGIDSKFAGTGTLNYALRIEGNTIRDYNGASGITLRSSTQDGGGTARTEVTIKNNTIAEVFDTAGWGIVAQIGGASTTTDFGKMGLDISNNNINISGGSTAQDAILIHRVSGNAQVYLPGYAGPANPFNEVSNYLIGKGNTLTSGPFNSGTGGAYVNGLVSGGAFVLPVPAMAANPNQGLGWEDLEVSPVSAPPRDPDVVAGAPDGGTGGDLGNGGKSGGETGGSAGGSGGGAVAGTPPAPAADDNVLTTAELDQLVEAAIQRWIDAGATPEQVAAMRAVEFGIVDMAGIYVGSSTAGVINIDSDGAGYGWFVDSTPGEDGEFGGSGTSLTADAGGAAAGKLDLLTVIMHELGHQIGLADDYASAHGDDLMYGYMNVGERRLPASGDAHGAVPGSVGATAFALTPVVVGTLPAGKTVDVFFNSTIASQTNQLITDLNNTATVSYDHDGNAGTPNLTVTANEITVIDTLALGDRAFIDANENGLFDSGEGVQGVTLALYTPGGSNPTFDANGDGNADTLIANTTTLAGGLYSFVGLAPGDYIVHIAQSNFNAGGALQGRAAIAGAVDPDNNEPNDSNGKTHPAAGNGVYSDPIRLAYNTEPSNGIGNDTNNTVDFGFFTPNQAPVIGAVTGDTGTFTENGSAVNIDAAGNATVTDGDSANFDGGSLTISMNGSNGDSIVFGGGVGLDGSNNVSVGATQIGTLDTSGGNIVITLNSNANAGNIQTLIRGLQFSSSGDNPTAGDRTITLTLVDGDGNDGGLGNDTGTASATITVAAVNDAPSGANNSDGVMDNAVLTFTASDFSTGMTDPENHGFAGVKITTLPSSGTIKLNGVAIAAGDTITKNQLDANELTYEPVAGSGGTSPTFTFQVQDDGGTANNGVDLDATANTFTINVAASDIAPVLDLNSDTNGTGYSGAYTEGGAAAAISDTDVLITDADAGDQVEGATITITNAVLGDVLAVVGPLPGSITVDAVNSTPTTLILTGTGTQAEYAAAIEQITFSSTSQNPTALGTNTSRTIEITVTDGDLPSNVAVATITVADDNADAPAGTSSTITAIEDGFRLLKAPGLGFTDSDGAFASVTISAVTGGGIYFDSDGSAGAGEPVLETLPKTYTAQDLIDGKVSFKAEPNANGSGLGTITFAVTDDDGNTDASPNTLTVDVTAANDSPVLTTGGPIAATEQTAVAILPAGSVADVDLDARNNGLGDYAGAQFSVNRNTMASTDDVFTLVAGPNFTIDGINLKTTGGQIFATISANNPGLIVINFNSSQAIATSALVDEVIQAIRYTNTSDNPPASVPLAVGFTDGSPGGGQGSGETGLDVNIVTVNIAGVNDAPINSLGGTIVTSEDSVDVPLSGMSISDPDANPATDKLYFTFQVGNGALEFRYDVPDGIVMGDVFGEAADGSLFSIHATLNQMNATLSATNGLTYTPKADSNGNDTLTVTTNDGGANGTDPGVSGETTNEEDVDTRTITVSAQPDAPVAQPDAVSTAENAIGTGSLLANNGSGADSDAEGDPITVSHVNGNPVVDGQVITLNSGAKLIVNSDGTYSYDPNGKFNELTDTPGAANRSAVDTFQYTVTGGNTVTVTVTVNGVASPGDRLMGDSSNNTIGGGASADVFNASQGGDDTLSGDAGDDIFYFGGALTADDNVDGGSGADTLVLQGDYSGGLVLDGSVTGI
ncbi:MAG TPA: Ig-like domain-containing protein, partial [Allosphingosinicella sp.]